MNLAVWAGAGKRHRRRPCAIALAARSLGAFVFGVAAYVAYLGGSTALMLQLVRVCVEKACAWVPVCGAPQVASL